MNSRKISFSFAVILISIVIFTLSNSFANAYELVFSTYLGGIGKNDQPRDIFVDDFDNIYITGTTNSIDFPTTLNAYDETHNGSSDVFVVKFNPTGRILWSTFLGGPGHDKAYAIEVDKEGFVFIAGGAGENFPTTTEAFQPNFKGGDFGIYGTRNSFVSKISPDGSKIVWSSYVGLGYLCRDMAVDKNGDVYLPLVYPKKESNSFGERFTHAVQSIFGKEKKLPEEWFAFAFQKKPKGSGDSGVIKIKSDGTKVIWATFLGGSGQDGGAESIRVDDKGCVYIRLATRSVDIPTTPGAHDRIHNGGVDQYIAKLAPDGSNLVWATFLGGPGDEWGSTHNLELDAQGNAYVTLSTNSSNFPTTPGAFDRTFNGGSVDIALSKLSSETGKLTASTFIGGEGFENSDGIGIDATGNIFLSGETDSGNFPITSDAYKSHKSAGADAILVIIAADFKSLRYSTLLGGQRRDNGRAGFLSNSGHLHITGWTNSSDWPVFKPYQDSYGGGMDGFVAKFALTGLDADMP